MEFAKHIRGTASADLAAFRFVVLNKTTLAVSYPAAGALADGVTIMPAKSGEPVAVVPLMCVSTPIHIECSANIARGANIATTADGRAVTGVATNKRLAFAFEAGSVDTVIGIYNTTTFGETL